MNPDAAYGNGAGEYLTNVQPIHQLRDQFQRWLELQHGSVVGT
jgi:hypothetical protein